MLTYNGLEKLNNSNPKLCIASKIMKAHRIINSVFRNHLKAFGITNSQMSILFILSKKGPVNQAELAKILFMEKSTVNRNLKRLIENKIITKKDFPIITITDKGLQLLNTIIPHWENAMDESKEKLGQQGLQALDILIINLTKN